MIERNTYGSPKEFLVLDFIYDYYDKSDFKTKKKINKIMILINNNISLIRTIDNLKFKLNVAETYYKSMKLYINDLSLDIEIKNRINNFNSAKFSILINKTKKEKKETKNYG